jgi:hypothetical protein
MKNEIREIVDEERSRWSELQKLDHGGAAVRERQPWSPQR